MVLFLGIRAKFKSSQERRKEHSATPSLAPVPAALRTDCDNLFGFLNWLLFPVALQLIPNQTWQNSLGSIPYSPQEPH
ncbi:MAG: hypothetical protein PUP92_14780 [Rhizonema sp. PD38]|nr:hypothetical protein [Rhizonema sp. PD38]